MIKVSIIEDQLRIYEGAVSEYDAQKNVNCWYRNTEIGYAKLINDADCFMDCLTWAAGASGDQAVILDLNLGQRTETREEIRRRYSIPAFVANLELIQESIDGISIALSFIRSLKKGRLLILLCSTYGRERAQRYLNIEAEGIKGTDAKIVIECASGGGLADTGPEKVFNELRYHWARNFGGDPYELFISEIEHTKPERFTNINSLHTWVGQLTIEDCRKFFGILLPDFNEEELLRRFNDGAVNMWQEVIKSLVGVRPGLSAAAGWLLVLAAYLAVDGGRDWETIFKWSDVAKYALGPFLNEEGPSLAHRQNVNQAFYRMCKSLADREGRSLGPLTKVLLSSDSGLILTLNLREYARLANNISKWRNKTLGWQNIPDSEASHDTSRAVWEYWIASSVLGGGAVSGRRMFHCLGGSDLWRMNIVNRKNGDTEVIFYNVQ